MKQPKAREKKRELEQILAGIKDSNGIMSVMASRLGIAVSTLYNYRNQYPEVRAAIEDERERLKDIVESALLKQIKADNLTAIIFYLKTQAKDRGYIERVEIEGNVNISIINQTIAALRQAGLDPAEVFNNLIAEAAHVSADDSTTHNQ